MSTAHWEITTVPAGYQLTLVGANGEEVLRAMTIYNDKRDAEQAIALAGTIHVQYKEA